MKKLLVVNIPNNGELYGTVGWLAKNACSIEVVGMCKVMKAGEYTRGYGTKLLGYNNELICWLTFLDFKEGGFSYSDNISGYGDWISSFTFSAFKIIRTLQGQARRILDNLDEDTDPLVFTLERKIYADGISSA